MVLLIRNVINTYVNVNKYRFVNVCGSGLLNSHVNKIKLLTWTCADYISHEF
jgi:hypothetical protein